MKHRNPIIDGSSFGRVYHGGKKKITSIDPDKLQARDYGFYGEGFYVTKTKAYARTYGPAVSTFEFTPDAEIVSGELDFKTTDLDTKRRVLVHIWKAGYQRAKARGKLSAFRDELSVAITSPVAWKNALYRFAKENGFDAVRFSDGEIVVIRPESLRVVK